MEVFMIQGKLVFRVLMKNKIHLEGCLTDQTMQVGALLMTQLKKWLHHQERSISSLQRYISCYIFEIEREALPLTAQAGATCTDLPWCSVKAVAL
jgi:hypothetical protein